MTPIRHIPMNVTVVQNVTNVTNPAPAPNTYLAALRLALRDIFGQLSPDDRDRLFELRSFLRIAFDNHEPEITIWRRLYNFDTTDSVTLESAKQQALDLPQWSRTYTAADADPAT